MTVRPPLLEALADVRDLRRRVLDAQLFRGYSGRARIAGGCVALLGALVLSSGFVPRTTFAHVAGWGTVCGVSALVNFCLLAQWWRGRDAQIEQLRPVLDLAAPFLVGGLLTAALIFHNLHDLLFPIWMWLFGLMNISSRHSMPRMMVYLGWYYIAAGTVCALPIEGMSFLNPWPMGIVFFIGELIGGITFVKLRTEED